MEFHVKDREGHNTADILGNFGCRLGAITTAARCAHSKSLTCFRQRGRQFSGNFAINLNLNKSPERFATISAWSRVRLGTAFSNRANPENSAILRLAK
jgi:hypothetical protein